MQKAGKFKEGSIQTRNVVSRNVAVNVMKILLPMVKIVESVKALL